MSLASRWGTRDWRGRLLHVLFKPVSRVLIVMGGRHPPRPLPRPHKLPRYPAAGWPALAPPSAPSFAFFPLAPRVSSFLPSFLIIPSFLPSLPPLLPFLSLASFPFPHPASSFPRSFPSIAPDVKLYYHKQSLPLSVCLSVSFIQDLAGSFHLVPSCYGYNPREMTCLPQTLM